MTQTQQLHLGDLFRSRRQKGRAGLPVVSVTMNDGLVHRDTLERKTNGTLAPDQHLLICKGDIAYNMMRMWQGASGLADKDGIVSPAYVVVAPQDGIDPLFASYWFKSDRMIYLFWAYSYGITGDRLRLYYKDFAKIPVTVPPKPEQERIGRILSTVDRAMERTGRIIEAKRKLKKGLAQQLLTGQRRLPGFGEPAIEGKNGKESKCGWIPSDWECVHLRDIACLNPDTLPESTPADYSYWYIDLSMVKQGVVEFPDEQIRFEDAPSRARRVVAKGDITMATVRPNLRGYAFWPNAVTDVVCSTGFAVIRVTDASALFVYQWLYSTEVARYFYGCIAGTGYPALNPGDVESIAVPCPPRDEQDRIAAVLGAADREIALLEKKLAALSELKRGLMQRLLSSPMETHHG